MELRKDADKIIQESIRSVLPDEAVSRALFGKTFPGRVFLVAIGKAGYQMARAASNILKEQIEDGVVVTKYGHVQEPLLNIRCYEAGHPVPDENSFSATQKALNLVKGLKESDTVLFLISGGGSALFEKPLIDAAQLQDITQQMLACGADIVEMNTIRKRLSAVKGGKFALACEPAHVFSIVLSDILGDPLDMIASGPAYPDSATSEQALQYVKKYQLKLSDEAMKLLEVETPKELSNVETIITGSVRNLCQAAADSAKELGYETVILTDQLTCEAREAGRFLSAIAKSYQESDKSLAFIAGGETVVHLTGKGKGGRNQEIALGAAEGLDGLKDTAVFSVGSDGTDGPTDAAGGYADDKTMQKLQEQGIDIFDVLKDNDAYHALSKCDGLVVTGPTGTNVNDVAVLLVKR